MNMSKRVKEGEMELVEVQLKVAGKGRLQVPGGIYRATEIDRAALQDEKRKGQSKAIQVKEEVCDQLFLSE